MENITIDDLLVTFGARYNKRSSKNQKIRFLTVLMQNFEELGFRQTEIFKQKFQKKTSYISLVGDLDKADHLFITHYDTPVYDFTRSEYEPFNDDQLSKRNTVNYIVPMLLTIAVLFLVAYFGLIPNFQDNQFTFMDILMFLIVILLVIFMTQIAKSSGLSKRENLIRNTSSVVAMLEFAKKLPKNKKKKVAFAFVDHGSTDNLGYYFLKEYLTDNHFKTTTILDSVGSGNIEQSKTKSEILSSYFEDVQFVYGQSDTLEDDNIENNIEQAVEILQTKI